MLVIASKQFSNLKTFGNKLVTNRTFDSVDKRRVREQCLCLLSLAAISMLCVQAAASAQLDKRDYMVGSTPVITTTGDNRQTTPIELNTIKATKAVQADNVSRLRPDGGNSGADSLATTAATTTDGDYSVTTLLIDYDQQGYASSTPRPPPTTSTIISDNKPQTVAVTLDNESAATTAVPVTLSTPTTKDDEEIRRGRATDVDTVDVEQETVGQAVDQGPQPAKLIRADPADLVGSKLPLLNLPASVSKLADKEEAEEREVEEEEEPNQTSRVGNSLARKQQPARDQRQTDIYIPPKRPVNESNIHELLLRKKPHSKYWTVEQKWDDIFKRLLSVQDAVKNMLIRGLIREVENYADVTLSQQCSDDLKWIQEYQKKSTNFRWLAHMGDAAGKNEPGLLTGNMADLGHVIQCIKVRAPKKFSNDSFDERYFEVQTETLGERFRGKYCLTSIRPVLPDRPKLISRFNKLMDTSILSNISFFGENSDTLKRRIHQVEVSQSARNRIDRHHNRIDQVPFESEFFQYLIDQRNFMYSLPRFVGMCFPSSCTKDDVRRSFQKLVEDHHQVVDVEYECEQEEVKASSWFTFSRSVVYVFLFAVATITFGASLARHIMIDRLGLKKNSLNNQNSSLDAVLTTLELLSLDKCAGILFIKTKKASPMVDRTKLENNQSTSIDALKGFLILLMIYSQLIYLGCLPVPFMWSKWGAAMFPFYRSYVTQIFLNVSIWAEAFYIISAYLIGLKFLENNRPTLYSQDNLGKQPDLGTYVIKRYIRLVLPMVAFITLNYVWPRLSNGFVMQDQAAKLMRPCDNHGWTNLLMFHNHHALNETCLWPSHVSASYFQLHLISYPILLLLLFSLRTKKDAFGARKYLHILTTYSGMIILSILAIIGVVYPALKAIDQELIVPFLVDYIDFDNYQRVIEWTVTPTYNHLTSYMAGLALAYLVAKRRADSMHQRKGSYSDSQCLYLHKGNSTESMASAVHQGYDSYTMNQHQAIPNPLKMNNLKHLVSDSTNLAAAAADDEDDSLASRLIGYLGSALVFLLLLLSITSSWLWNGLGEPMSSSQTFWYMCGTKLIFTLSFAYLFYKHVATRRNAVNPWMITRFLVPIGRMSLTIFYLSWLVIWFDLLSSLYQWHPSHYFVFEKFSEIIFMVLVIGMIVYGCSEGTVKIISYRGQAEQLARQQRLGGSDIESDGFSSLFLPVVEDECQDKSDSDTLGKSTVESSPASKISNNRMMEKSSMVQYLASDGKGKLVSSGRGGNSQECSRDDRCRRGATKDGKPDDGDRNLSIADQYKLNAELRANYSFASIGLYEKAGATDYLAPDPSDPQMSPSITSAKLH